MPTFYPYLWAREPLERNESRSWEIPDSSVEAVEISSVSLQ